MTEPIEDKPNLTIDDMGWTIEYALSIRAKFASVLEDWDDPEMDIYNAIPERRDGHKNPYLTAPDHVEGTIQAFPFDSIDTHNQKYREMLVQHIIWALQENDELRSALRIALGIDLPEAAE